MRDPVLCSNGHSYERTAIEALQNQTLIPNHALRNLIEAHLRMQTA